MFKYLTGNIIVTVNVFIHLFAKLFIFIVIIVCIQYIYVRILLDKYLYTSTPVLVKFI